MNERDRLNNKYYDAQFDLRRVNGSNRLIARNPSNEQMEEEHVSRHIYTYREEGRMRNPMVRSFTNAGTSSSTGPVYMPPMSTSYEYGRPSSRNQGDMMWHREDFRPGPPPSSATNVDNLFNRGAPRRDYSGDEAADLIFMKRTGPDPYRHRDYGVIGAYSSANEPKTYRAEYAFVNEGRTRQHGNEYELDPRLNVNYPQMYVDNWKEKHKEKAFPVQSNRAYEASNAHIYEDVPREPEYSTNVRNKSKETAILNDEEYDNVPKAVEEMKNLDLENKDEQNIDGQSGVYQPGHYQPSEDAGSSSDEDDPEYLELMERDSIINRYEKGPDGVDIDAWENPDFDVYTKLDRFGFVHKEGEKFGEPVDIYKRRIVRELKREKKWLKMIEVWKSGGPSRKMEDRIWKGIPEKLRLIVWPRLLGAERMKVEKKDVYSELLLRARLVSKDIKQIDLDINRTYRDHLAFRKRYDVKQKSLLNVLAAYSMYNTEVGYCQGMSQIAALFLMYLDEEDTFWCLHQLMVSPKHTMHGFFVPGFPKLQRFEEHFKKVLKKYKPRVYKHLEKQDIPYIYLTKWWFGCFLDRVPFSLALRLWDAFLVEGDPILIAMSLNIMKMHEKTIRKLTMETFMEFIQNDIANNFGYSDDETMHSLRETLVKLKSDRQHVPPPARPEDLAELPTKALGPILQKPMASIREEIHEIQSRKSRANSTGRSPHPKRKESSRHGSKGPPPVVHRWNDDSQKEVPFEIPTRRMGSNGDGYTSKPNSPRYNNHPRTPNTQRLRDEHNGQMILLSRASDSEGDTQSPMGNREWHHESKVSSSSATSSRITHAANNVTRIEIDGDVSVI